MCLENGKTIILNLTYIYKIKREASTAILIDPKYFDYTGSSSYSKASTNVWHKIIFSTPIQISLFAI